MNDSYYGQLIDTWSYTMDYETSEIIIRIVGDNDQVQHIRLSEKDSKEMVSWFELAKHMKRVKSK